MIDRLAEKLPWIYADGVSSFLHGLVVLLPSLALSFLISPVGGLIWAIYWEQFYLRREIGDYRRFRAELTGEKWRVKRLDCFRDFGYTVVPFIIACGVALERL